MAPNSKDTLVLTAPPETAAAVSAAPVPRHEDTAATSRPQPVALEVPVSVNGARTVEGSDKREPFSETTKTVLVFGNGAVIRLASPVSAGQLLFLTNEKTKKEVVCQVVKSKNYKSVSGYVELEFTESVVGFWGMRFPSDRIGTQTPASAPVATLLPAVKGNPVAPVAATAKPVGPVLSAAPRIPADISAVASAVPKPPAPLVQNTLSPVRKQPEVPAIPAPATSSSLASSLASLLGAPEAPPAAAPLSSESKQQPSSVVAGNSTEELKHQAARLQEQLSSMLFSAAPTAKPAPPAATVPALDPKVVSRAAAQVFDTKSHPAPVKVAAPARALPPHIKSSLDAEELKIPSWLEPLARNAAAPASTQELVEREKAKHATEITAREEHPAEPLPVATLERAPEVEFPGIGSLLPLDEPVTALGRSSGGSGRGVFYGVIAACVLLAAGGAWYFLHPAKAVEGTSAPITSVASSPKNAAPPAPAVTQPAALPASQNSVAVPQPSSGANPTPVSSVPSTKPPVNSEAAPVTRDNTRGAGTTIPAAVTERISRPPAEPQPKKPALGEVRLASPTINRRANAQGEGAEAPAISSGSSDANVGGLDSGFSAGNAKQPAAPKCRCPSVAT
jgi:hypothetical protein